MKSVSYKLGGLGLRGLSRAELVRVNSAGFDLASAALVGQDLIGLALIHESIRECNFIGRGCKSWPAEIDLL